MKILANGMMLCVAAGMVAACTDEPEPAEPAQTGGSAAGEVLEGSISDDMLPYDTLRSQAPLADPSEIPESEGGPAAPAPAPAPTSTQDATADPTEGD